MIRRIIRDEQGSAIVENTITMLVFVLLTMGITQAGLIMWSAVGLEHGVEMAARCASVSDAAIDAGFVPSTTTPTPCYSTSTKGATNNQSTGKAYAVSQSWGVGVPLSAFTFPSGSCASPSNQVSSSYSKTLMNYHSLGASPAYHPRLVMRRTRRDGGGAVPLLPLLRPFRTYLGAPVATLAAAGLTTEPQDVRDTEVVPAQREGF